MEVNVLWISGCALIAFATWKKTTLINTEKVSNREALDTGEHSSNNTNQKSYNDHYPYKKHLSKIIT